VMSFTITSAHQSKKQSAQAWHGASQQSVSFVKI